MKSGVINSKQLEKTKRWDAAYNLAFAKYEKPLERLLRSVNFETMVAVARSIPRDLSAAAVVSGSRTKKFSNWKPEELGLYLLQIQEKDTLRQQIATLESIAQETTSVLASTYVLIQKSLGKDN